MEISRQLLNPYLSRLRSEFEALDRELSLRGDAVEILPLADLTQSKIHQIEHLSASINEGEAFGAPEKNEEFQDLFRRLKLDLRCAQRKWLRVLSNESRIRKMREKKNHAATLAA
ncbi:MAG: hypothetical protein WC352_03525 [Candidatus Omnitrophota bacterium]|jgi:hypothetical protein